MACRCRGMPVPGGPPPVVSLLDVTTSGLRPQSPTARRLTDLAREFPELRLASAGSTGSAAASDDVALTGITLDSRAVQPGDLYAALPGARAHGASFAGQAREAGAVAVLTDPDGARRVSDAGHADVPLLLTDDPRGCLGA